MKSVVFVILILLSSSLFGQTFQEIDSVNYTKKEMISSILERHNYWRAKVGVPPMKWSNKLAKFAERWAKEIVRRRCKISHSPNVGKFANEYGENIYWSVGYKSLPSACVDSWASEIEFFDPKSGRCKGGVCGHYTQVVWKNSTKVGCAVIQCGKTEIWICEYDPSGNWVGEKPY